MTKSTQILAIVVFLLTIDVILLTIKFYDLQNKMSISENRMMTAARTSSEAVQQAVMPKLSEGSPAGDPARQIDIRETATDYSITLDWPKMEADDIRIELIGRELVISGEKDAADQGLSFGEKEFDYFSRKILLPDDVDPEAISTEFAEGILIIHVPKRLEKNGRSY